MRAFLLAGGFATRLWPLTEKRPKPLLPLAGKPTLNHIIDALPPEMPVTVSTNAAFENVFREWETTMRGRGNVELVIERTISDDQKLGTLGAVAQWLEQTGNTDDLLLIAGDNYFGFSMTAFLEQYHPGTALLAAHDIGDRSKASAFGTVILAADGKHIEAFEEKPSEPKTSLISTGVSILPASTLPILQEFAKVKPDNIGGIFEELLRRQLPVECFQFQEPWFDIGSFEAYLEATRMLVGDRMLGSLATFEDSTHEGSVVLGTGTYVKGSVLRNTVIFEDCRIDDCILENCVIDSDSVLTRADLTGKMIRAGTMLERP